jgi:hypothetical protein
MMKRAWMAAVAGMACGMACGARAAEPAAAPKGEPTNAAEAALQKKYGDKLKPADYAAYQKLVASLPADEQAWEKVLEDQLGGFYFPIHVRDRLAGRETAWTFVKDDPALPRVLLIGDSISRAYTLDVRKALAGKANVHRAPANCGPTDTGLKCFDVWLGTGRWDVIHVNFGIHDRRKTPEQYAANLEKVVERLKQTGARLVWARTTPFRDKDSTVEDGSVALNETADAVMKKHGIPLNDLHAAILPSVATARGEDGTHFNADGVRILAARVVKCLEPMLR